MEEVIDWHSIPRGSAFTFVGMPSDVDIVYYLGRSLVTPLIAILESESGAIYKKPLAVLRHWPEHDKRAQPAVDEAALEAVQFCLSIIRNNKTKPEDNAIWSCGTSSKPRITQKVLEACEAALAQSTQSPVEQPPQTVAGDMPDAPWLSVAEKGLQSASEGGAHYMMTLYDVRQALKAVRVCKALTRHEGA